MKSKMTDYKGVYFRSRLEVKWCMFFESLGVRFEYEPESKRTTRGQYVPDFYFRSLKTWVEIKGTHPTEKELTKIKDVCRSTNKIGFIISGYPKAYTKSVEPHLANAGCHYITKKGVSYRISVDKIYQLIKNIRILHQITHCSKPSYMVGVDLYELTKYQNLEPAKAKFKPNKINFLNDIKKLINIFK